MSVETTMPHTRQREAVGFENPTSASDGSPRFRQDTKSFGQQVHRPIPSMTRMLLCTCTKVRGAARMLYRERQCHVLCNVEESFLSCVYCCQMTASCPSCAGEQEC